jgi:hypothetical protein
MAAGSLPFATGKLIAGESKTDFKKVQIGAEFVAGCAANAAGDAAPGGQYCDYQLKEW